jgi:hypothetical protein
MVAWLAASDTPPTTVPAAPTPELLAYLAEFADSEGNYVDPTEVATENESTEPNENDQLPAKESASE